MSDVRLFDRELSWLEFNARVLDEAAQEHVPLLERARFAAICSSNLDEFFMVRVGALKRALAAAPQERYAELIDRVRARASELVEGLNRLFLDTLAPKLAARRIRWIARKDLGSRELGVLQAHFEREALAVLTPVRVEAEGALPFASGLRLHALFRLESAEREGEPLYALLQLPPSLERIVWVSRGQKSCSFALLEDAVMLGAAKLFPGHTIKDTILFRVTRDADLPVDEQRDEDFVRAMEEVLASRGHSFPVRLETAGGSAELREWLRARLGLDARDCFETVAPLDLGFLASLASLEGWDALRNEEWPPFTPPELSGGEPIWDLLKKSDLLLHHPYESFEPVVRLLSQAADDPYVLAIKMTLYRTSGKSPIVEALARAAANGKQVAVVVELKARFDEARNIEWARRLERAGGIVVYGIAGLKVHAKALLIVRKEADGVQRYLHLGTGNYNERTARLYADFALLTAREQLTYEAALFFNAITGYSSVPVLRKLVMAPHAMKSRVIELIRREAERSSPGAPGRIIAKMNSLSDPEVIAELYAASRAGVRVDLIVRGICTLVPGVPGMSETITAVSVLDRFLEHSRILYFANGGAEEVYLSSADWMPRNLTGRVELMFPVEQPDRRRRLVEALEAYLADNTQAHGLGSDGRYLRRTPAPGEERVRCQSVFYQRAQRRAEPPAIEPLRDLAVRRRPRPTSR